MKFPTDLHAHAVAMAVADAGTRAERNPFGYLLRAARVADPRKGRDDWTPDGRHDIRTETYEDDAGRVWRTCAYLDDSEDIGDANYRYITGERSPVRETDYFTDQVRGTGYVNRVWLIDTPRVRAAVFARLDGYAILSDDVHSQVEMEYQDVAMDDYGWDECERELVMVGGEFYADVYAGEERAERWELHRMACEAGNCYPEVTGEGRSVRVNATKVAAATHDIVTTAADLVPHITPTVGDLVAGRAAYCVITDALADSGMDDDHDAMRKLRADRGAWAVFAILRLLTSADVTDFWFRKLAVEWAETPEDDIVRHSPGVVAAW